MFVHTVWTTLAMPDFDNTLLGLMGISSGTYIGVKMPEGGKADADGGAGPGGSPDAEDAD